MAQEFYSLEEAARILEMTPAALDQLRKEAKIPCFEEDGTVLFRVTELDYIRAEQSKIFGKELSASDPQRIVPEAPKRTTASKPKTGLNVPAPDGGFNRDVAAELPAAAAPPPVPAAANDFTINTDDFDVGAAPARTGNTGLSPAAPAKTGNTGLSPAAPARTGSTGRTPGAPARTGSTGMTPGAPPQTRPPTVAPPPADPSEDIFSVSVDEVKLQAAPAPAPPPSQSDDIFSVDLDNVKLLDEPPPAAAPPAFKTPAPAPSTEELDGDLGVPSGSDAVPLNDDFGIPPPEPIDLSGSDVMPLSAPADEPAPTVPSAPALEPEPLAESSSDDFSMSTGDFAGMSPEPAPAGAEPPPPPAEVEPSGSAFDLTLDADADAAPAAGVPGAMPAGAAAGDDAEIMFGDIDTSSLGDDSMIGIGEPAPDSVVGLGPPASRKQMKPPGAGAPANLDLMPTDSIDLDAELQQAADQSLARKGPGKSKVAPSRLASGKTKPPGQEPELPASPFELSEADLEVPASLGASTAPTSESNFDAAPALSDSSFDGPPAGASEFELTLAPEDENVDLGGAPAAKNDGSSTNRAALSGINLQAPADSGISLEGDSSESVDFELTLDDESGGPKTARGLAGAVDSDSEFELTLDEASGPATIPPQKKKSRLTGEQDIFETDFELPAVSGEESASQAVALEESDTDLESSDFDLAIEEVGDDDSGSQVVAMDESIDGGGGSKAMTDASLDQSMADADFTSDEELLEPEASSDGESAEEEEPAPITVPAAEADWGLYPLLMMIPCVVIMSMGLLMSYELLHNMWGYHQPTKPSGLLVEGFASMFKDSGQ